MPGVPPPPPLGLKIDRCINLSVRISIMLVLLVKSFFFFSSIWKRTSREKEKKEKGETQEASQMNFEDVFQLKKNYDVVASVLT